MLEHSLNEYSLYRSFFYSMMYSLYPSFFSLYRSFFYSLMYSLCTYSAICIEWYKIYSFSMSLSFLINFSFILLISFCLWIHYLCIFKWLSIFPLTLNNTAIIIFYLPVSMLHTLWPLSTILISPTFKHICPQSIRFILL